MADGEAAPAEASSTAGADSLSFIVVFGKESQELVRNSGSTVGELKAEIEGMLQMPSAMQKLMCSGKMLKDDGQTLAQAGIKNKAKLMLIGTRPAETAVAKPAGGEPAAAGTDLAWDAPVSNEPLSKQQPHAKVLEKGLPEDAVPGVAGRQVPFTDAITCIPGLLNSQGVKVRLTFKPELEQIWVGSATSTQKVPYGSISKIESFPIDGREEYSIVSLQLGSTGHSKYLLYFFPSQYVSGLKLRILGVMALM